MADPTNLGKKGEGKVKEWLDRPQDGYLMMRLPDQMTGLFGSKNMCDFLLYKKPYFFPIECKSTWEDRFPFSMITDYQHDEMIKASKVEGVTSYIITLFASHQRAFIFDINDIDEQMQKGVKSVNIKKIDKWPLKYIEIPTLPSRKQLLDYDPAFEDPFTGGAK